MIGQSRSKKVRPAKPDRFRPRGGTDQRANQQEEVAVITRKILPAALGLWLSASGVGSLCGQEVQQPSGLGFRSNEAIVAAANQRGADAIAASLRQSGVLRSFRVDIAFTDGLAELTGLVQDQTQRDEVLRVVRGVSGVRMVRDRLMLVQAPAVRPAQAQENVEPQVPTTLPPPLPVQAGRGTMQEPLSIIPPMMATGANSHMQPPPMPPYAWPTYAPYNNFSRVAAPQNYPYEAFPFIGPMYPFPKVPPGWRAVSLRWQDGYWWYGREATGHDWWRVRYW